MVRLLALVSMLALLNCGKILFDSLETFSQQNCTGLLVIKYWKYKGSSVAQLVEQSLQTPEVPSSNPVIGKSIPVTCKPQTKTFHDFWSGIQFTTLSRELEKVSTQVSLTSESCLRFCAIYLQMSFLALAIMSKKNPKLSVKLAQSGCDFAQSVKLGVQQSILNIFCQLYRKDENKLKRGRDWPI